MSVRIREHRPGKDVDDFIEAAHVVFRGDPAWVPPLEMEMRERLDPKKNPFFEHAEGTLLTAWKDGQLVGRCSAQIDHEHLRVHQDETGFFGFLDTVDDLQVTQGLLDAAEGWLRDRGMKRMRGPLSLSINEEIGTLIEGFEHPPAVMMPHSRPYQAGLIEGAGMAKAKDLYAWRYDVGNLPKRAQRAWEQIQALPEVRLRSVRKSHMQRELRIIMDIFNEAWSGNWGFVPLTESEVKKVAQDLKLIIDEDLAFIAEVKGRPVGMCICLPNLNESIHDLGGKLMPFGLPKLLWRLKVRGARSARLMLLGLRQEVQASKRYAGLSTAMYAEIARRGKAKGIEWAELSWTLEDNRPINLGIKAMGAEIYKKYRVFEKDLTGA
jgi:GNAT superfamily N-acetyltransferase